MTIFTRPPGNLFRSGAIASLILSVFPVVANAQIGKGMPFCKNLYNPDLNPTGKIFASPGAQMFCFGPLLRRAMRPMISAAPPQTAGQPGVASQPEVASASGIENVNAADSAEDISPNGTQAYGQI